MPRVVGFDIETTSDSSFNINQIGITCAAMWNSEDNKSVVCYGAYSEGAGMYAPRMSQAEAIELVDWLWQAFKDGKMIATWNGTGFDFPVLARQSGCFEECKELALHHVDLPFSLLCTRGFMVGLEAASRGMGLGGKAESQGGGIAPILWKRDLESQKRVLRYVEQDARLTGKLFLAIEEQGYLAWQATSGRKNIWEPPMSPHGEFMTVQEALELPLPDTSWMQNPRTRQSVIAWMSESQVDAEGAEEIPTDVSELRGNLLTLDLERDAEAAEAAHLYAELIEDQRLELSQRIRSTLRTLGR